MSKLLTYEAEVPVNILINSKISPSCLVSAVCNFRYDNGEYGFGDFSVTYLCKQKSPDKIAKLIFHGAGSGHVVEHMYSSFVEDLRYVTDSNIKKALPDKDRKDILEYRPPRHLKSDGSEDTLVKEIPIEFLNDNDFAATFGHFFYNNNGAIKETPIRVTYRNVSEKLLSKLGFPEIQ